MKKFLLVYAFLATLLIIWLYRQHRKYQGEGKYVVCNIPNYDSLGNCYMTDSIFDHIPNKQEWDGFNKKADTVISQMMQQNLNP